MMAGVISDVLSRIREQRDERDRQRSLRTIRETFAWFGYPLDDLSDEEIEESVMRSAEAFASAGMTMDEATEAFAELGRMLREGDHDPA